jgi:hypothetical protein
METTIGKLSHSEDFWGFYASHITGYLCIHGAIVLRESIRDKDKDPSFSAKQLCNRGGACVLFEPHLCIGALASFRRLERMTAFQMWTTVRGNRVSGSFGSA